MITLTKIKNYYQLDNIINKIKTKINCSIKHLISNIQQEKVILMSSRGNSKLF
jgi:hypothetical protein